MALGVAILGVVVVVIVVLPARVVVVLPPPVVGRCIVREFFLQPTDCWPRKARLVPSPCVHLAEAEHKL